MSGPYQSHSTAAAAIWRLQVVGYLHPVWWKAVACASAAGALLFSTSSTGSGVLAEQNSMASGHIGAACWTSQALHPSKHSCSETRLLLECSKQGSAAGFDSEITGYSSISDFWRKKHLLAVVFFGSYMMIAEINLIFSKTFHCFSYVAVLQIITTKFSVLFNCC